MKTPQALLALTALAFLLFPTVVTAAGTAPVPPGVTAPQETPGSQADKAALEQCMGKVKADRAKLKQDRQAMKQLRQNQTGDKGTQQELQGLRKQLQQDRKAMKEDKSSCMRLYREMRKNGRNLQNTPSRTTEPSEDTP